MQIKKKWKYFQEVSKVDHKIEVNKEKSICYRNIRRHPVNGPDIESTTQNGTDTTATQRDLPAHLINSMD